MKALITVEIPIILTKKGKPRKKQTPLFVMLNGHAFCLSRGVRIHTAPTWILSFCEEIPDMVVRYGNRIIKLDDLTKGEGDV